MPPTSRISVRVAAITESATLAVDAKAKALKAAGEPVIGFGAGEPDFPTPAPIVAAVLCANAPAVVIHVDCTAAHCIIDCPPAPTNDAAVVAAVAAICVAC